LPAKYALVRKMKPPSALLSSAVTKIRHDAATKGPDLLHIVAICLA